MKKLFLLLLIAPVLGLGQGEQRYAEGTATDQDGNTFELIKYGTQDWAIENAKVVTYRDGIPIPQVTDATEWGNLATGAWCYYDNDPTKGKLYNWYAVMGVHDEASMSNASLRKEFAPVGWRVPTDAEFSVLEQHLITEGYNWDGSNTDSKIGKSMASTTGWNNHNEEGNVGNDQSLNNKSGFNAYPVGRREPQYGNIFMSEGVMAMFWCGEQGPYYYKDYNSLSYSRQKLDSSSDNMQMGMSVRFVRNASNDTDSDGITNDMDNCPNTAIGQAVDGNGCSDSQLLSTNDYHNTITIYPNPTTSVVTLQGGKQYDIEVYTLQGKKVMALTGNTIDMSHLSSATYIVKALDKVENKEVSYKVVKN